MGGIDNFTKLMLHCDGADASTTFTDSSNGQAAKTMTAVGDAQIDTAQFKFGTASGLFDGTGDYLTTPDSSDFDFSGGVWTVDFWIRPASLLNNGVVFSQSTDTNNRIYVLLESTGKLSLTIDAAGVSVIALAGTVVLSINTWYHVAIVENGSDYYIFVNGTQDVTVNDADRAADYTGVFTIGSMAAASYINGWIDEFRVSNGVARWIANFTPSTVAYDGNNPGNMFQLFE